MWLAAALVIAQVGWPPSSAGRPRECSERSGHAPNVWERAKSPELRRYCDLVASASSKLAGTSAMAEAALLAAREADGVLGGHGAPKALEGRALASLGRLGDALVALKDAQSRDGQVFDDPPTLLAWARVLARTGHADQAREAYRALLPRAGVLPSAERAAAATEAGLVAMSCGPAGLDDAAASLRDAMREAQDDTAPVAALGLALALDRRGQTSEAHAVLVDRARLLLPSDPAAGLATSRARELLSVAPDERDALVALATEATNPARARGAWLAIVASNPAGPWAAHARMHLAALGDKHSRGTP